MCFAVDVGCAERMTKAELSQKFSMLLLVRDTWIKSLHNVCVCVRVCVCARVCMRVYLHTCVELPQLI